MWNEEELNKKFVVAEIFAELVSKGIKAILFIFVYFMNGWRDRKVKCPRVCAGGGMGGFGIDPYISSLLSLFMIDLDKTENTCVCLSIIKIEPNFRSLFYHDSIIKIFCSREQSTSYVHAHTFIELKKDKIKKGKATKL